MVRGADILVLSSHQIAIVRNWCSRVVWLDQGQVIADGPTDEVLDRYLGSAPEQPVAALA
jgi:lipopolysaccharide transport system ATP-binding protein